MAEPPTGARAQGGALAVLQKFYAAEAAYIAAGGMGRASFDELAECLDPEVLMHQAPGLPYGGTWRGARGIEEFMAAMSEAWQSLEFFEQRFVVEGDTVVVLNRGRLRARATGRALDTSVMQLITVKDGLISEIHPFYWDTMAVAEALRPQ
ncbi:nuclear transport factor 2 family protein [Kitasatospora sp. NBC_01287]|uniref:nuclear transport factor 2 family protein n=1 Tax=Kitasatospora sp. NBC_01287 TaxID=2903573 RepID=UPI0022527062|nr:nuclear transport factor 2 family protein [Kitasatospora sp. NBC_01287]MCX4744446.1 nuclear transport factor 2 family protein [Kitasatospora sp. NBC_01287]